jgi:hypothetical protein
MVRGKHLLEEIFRCRSGVVDTSCVRTRDETGASLVEFALVLPIFMLLLLGMFTGGLAYSRKTSVSQAAREGARYGATLPITSSLPVDAWLDKVAAITIDSGDGELAPTQLGQSVCVAYVPGAGSPRRRQQVGTAVSFSNGTCIGDDGRAGETRVQIVTHRTSKFEALVFSRDLDLTARAVARFEAL